MEIAQCMGMSRRVKSPRQLPAHHEIGAVPEVGVEPDQSEVRSTLIFERTHE
jgi:hypothetical protein